MSVFGDESSVFKHLKNLHTMMLAEFEMPHSDIAITENTQMIREDGQHIIFEKRLSQDYLHRAFLIFEDNLHNLQRYYQQRYLILPNEANLEYGIDAFFDNTGFYADSPEVLCDMGEGRIRKKQWFGFSTPVFDKSFISGVWFERHFSTHVGCSDIILEDNTLLQLNVGTRLLELLYEDTAWGREILTQDIIEAGMYLYYTPSGEAYYKDLNGDFVPFPAESIEDFIFVNYSLLRGQDSADILVSFTSDHSVHGSERILYPWHISLSMGISLDKETLGEKLFGTPINKCPPPITEFNFNFY